MKDFTFCVPTKIVFGKGRTAEIGKHIASLGKNVLLVYGESSIKTNGIYNQVTKSLAESDIKWIDFGGVKSNPLLSKVQEGISIFKKKKLDAILAVGGGSVIDTAKTIAAGVKYEGDIWEYFTGKGFIKDAAPVAVVLTMAATASEMNATAVITHDTLKSKLSIAGQALYPKISVLDPINTLGAPLNYSMYGAVDAISHLLEGYFNGSSSHSPLQDTLAEGLVRNIIGSANIIYKDPENYNARAELMWAATLALNGLSVAGIGSVGFPMHMIAHSLSALYDIPHGAALAVVIPAWLKFHLTASADKIAQFSRYVFRITIENDFDAATEGIVRLEKWFKLIDCPTRLKDIDIPAHDIKTISLNALVTAKQWGLKNYTPEVIESILLNAARS